MFEGEKRRISVVIPAYNEENAVGKVIDDIPKWLVDEIIVVNNNSNDNTSNVAELAGATKLDEAVSGYAGGKIRNPTYAQVSSGRTRHAEAVEVHYDSEEVSYATLLKVFFGSHDPLSRRSTSHRTSWPSGAPPQTPENCRRKQRSSRNHDRWRRRRRRLQGLCSAAFGIGDISTD